MGAAQREEGLAGLCGRSICRACKSLCRACRYYLVGPKLLYLFLNMMLYSTYTFAASYFEQTWGLQMHYFGYIIFLCGIVSFVGSLTWTALADRTGRHKELLILMSLASCLSFLALRSNSPSTLPFAARLLYVSLCVALSNFFSSALYPLLDSCVMAHLADYSATAKELFGRQRLFGAVGQSLVTALSGVAIDRHGSDAMFAILVASMLLFILVVATSIGRSPPPPHGGDRLPKEVPSRVEEGLLPQKSLPASSQDDGRASQSAACQAAAIAPLIVHRTPAEGRALPGQDEPLPRCGGLHDATAGAAAVVALDVDRKGAVEAEAPLHRLPARTLFGTYEFSFFLAIILIAGTSRGVVGNYLPLYFEKEMSMDQTHICIMMQTRIITEIGVFFMEESLMRRIGGANMLLLAQATGLLRVLAYAILPAQPPWTLLPLAIELFKGISNACLVSAGVHYVHSYSSSGREATAQGFFTGVYCYLANASSGLFGGLVLHVYSDAPHKFRTLFTYTSVLSLLGIIWFLLQAHMLAAYRTGRVRSR